MFNAFKKYIKKTLSMVTATTIIAVTVFSMAAPVAAATGSTDTSAAWPDAPSITCESAILIDAKRMPTASVILLPQPKFLLVFLLLKTVT